MVITGEHLSAAIVARGRIERHKHGHKGPRKRRPGDVILVEIVALRSRRLEDELVLEQTRFLAIEGGEHVEDAGARAASRANRAEIDDRVESLEQALVGFDVRLPAATNVVHVHEVAPLQQALRFQGGERHLRHGKQPANDEVAIAPVLGDLFLAQDRGCREDRGGHGDLRRWRIWIETIPKHSNEC